MAAINAIIAIIDIIVKKAGSVETNNIDTAKTANPIDPTPNIFHPFLGFIIMYIFFYPDTYPVLI
jgi:hypothetical protein